MYSSKIFYTKFALSYESYALTKNIYLLAVNDFITQRSKYLAKMIDVGSGNGIRSKKIAGAIMASKLVLLDNSPGMVSLSKNIKGVKVISGDISDTKLKIGDKFDVVICLWNVLGHISTVEKREIAMKNLKELTSQNGCIFIDVNNRYNISQYGLKNVIKNILKDIIYQKSNGDFELVLQAENEKIKTKVHIFSPIEMEKLIKNAGLKIVEKKIINYRTGREHKSIFSGQLVYKLLK